MILGHEYEIMNSFNIKLFYSFRNQAICWKFVWSSYKQSLFTANPSKSRG